MRRINFNSVSSMSTSIMEAAKPSCSRKRRKTLTGSERKRRKLARDKTYRGKKVNLGAATERWNSFKSDLDLPNDEETAVFLLDRLVKTALKLNFSSYQFPLPLIIYN